jgi:cyclase
MKNALGLVSIVAAAAFGSFAAAQQLGDFDKVEIKVTKVAGSVYMLEGAGGNIGASVGEDGIVIVDDQFAPLADKIRAALRSVTDKPLRFIINTHYHYDHTSGNQALGKLAPVIAHENVRKRLASGTRAGAGSMSFQQDASPADALPVITFEHDVSLHVNGEDIRALHVPNGHTDGDSMVFFPRSNVVHMGDDFVTYGFPFVDLNAGGSVQGMIQALENTIAQLPADVKVIPGHGPVSTLDDVRGFIQMLKDTRAAVEKGVKGGKNLEQLKKEKVLGPWEKKYSGSFISSDIFVETLYGDLTGQKAGPAVKHN